MAAFEVLNEICQEFSDELVNGSVGSSPRVDASQTAWTQPGDNALVRDRDERAGSSNAAMSAMYAVMKMFYSRHDIYISCMQELQRAQAAQRRMRGRVHRHQRAVRAAQNEIGNYMIAFEAHWGQFVRAIVERDVAIAEVQGIRVETDEANHLAETREAARIWMVFQAARQATEFDHRE